MKLKPDHYYHLYNRTNNRELLFKEKENYLYFLRNFRDRFQNLVTVFAYCLMPTHFHFLIKIDTEDTVCLKKQVGIHLSSYTKAINNKYDRHGSLFQIHTKAKNVNNAHYLLTLITYIHQNPVRSKLVTRLEDWPFSSYLDLAGQRKGTLVDNQIINEHFKTRKRFIEFSEQTIAQVKDKYWV